jgi:hypothetical protein
MIVEALAAGGATGKDTEPGTSHDAYVELRELVRRRFAAVLPTEKALVEHEKAPEVWHAPLAAALETTGAGHDEQIIEAARRVLALVEKSDIPWMQHSITWGSHPMLAYREPIEDNFRVNTFLSDRAGRRKKRKSTRARRKGRQSIQTARAKFVAVPPGLDIKYVERLPASIYLAVGEEDTIRQVITALQDVAEQVGFDLIAESDPVYGSFWQRFKAKASDPQTQEALHDRLIKLERSAEVRLLAVPESQANMQNAQGLAAIIEALKGEPAAVVQLGPLVVVKTPTPDTGSAILCRMLTAKELRMLQTRPDLLKDPSGLMAELTASGYEPEIEQEA